MDHLIDNPSDVVGLELGPGDEPLLPGTLLPMRGVRATDNPPPTFSGSSSTAPTGAGGGGGMLDAGGAGSGQDEEAYSSFPVAEGGAAAGDGSGGAKSESMRRSVHFALTGGAGSLPVAWLGCCVGGCFGGLLTYVLYYGYYGSLWNVCYLVVVGICIPPSGCIRVLSVNMRRFFFFCSSSRNCQGS